jgi:hypothetical protein
MHVCGNHCQYYVVEPVDTTSLENRFIHSVCARPAGLRLQSSVPVAWCDSTTGFFMAALREFSCAGCGLSGPTLPRMLGCSLLELYNVSINAFTADLSQADIAGANLKQLAVGINPVTGTLPPGWPSQWPLLNTIGLVSTHVTGTLPPGMPQHACQVSTHPIQRAL